MTVVDEVKSRLDIVEIVSETVTLKKSGQSYTGFCPFHQNTKTPSFVVFPHTQTWRCFGACAEGGDLFSFIIKRDGCDFKEALTTLATRAGVALKQSSPTPEQDNYTKKLQTLNIEAANYYHHLLLNNRVGAQTLHYLTQRAITPQTIATFQLGYAPNRWDNLKSHFLNRGYTPDDLINAGLVKRQDNGSLGNDRFRNRLMIPIRDHKGQVVGFGARALLEGQVPKYLNSPQTTLFDKRTLLYGLDLARKHIYTKKQVVIVEGYMDVIQAYQQGAKNVVAQMGTALTETQLQRITLGSPKIILALDSDAAGNTATIRGLSLARQALPKRNRPTPTAKGIAFEAHLTQEIYVVPLPQGKDPDDVLRQGLNVWQALLEQAMPALDFYEKLILNNTDIRTPAGKAHVVHSLVPIYREIADEIEKAARVQQLARTIGIDERLLMAELQSTTKPTKSTRPVSLVSKIPQKKQLDTSTKLRPEDHCLAMIIAYPKILPLVNDGLAQQNLPNLNVNDFNQGDNKEIFKYIQLWTISEIPRLETLIDMVDMLLTPRLQFLANQGHQDLALPIEKLRQDLQATILQLRKINIQKQVDELTFLQRSGDSQTIQHYNKIEFDYRRELHKLNIALSNVRGTFGSTSIPNIKYRMPTKGKPS